MVYSYRKVENVYLDQRMEIYVEKAVWGEAEKLEMSENALEQEISVERLHHGNGRLNDVIQLDLVE